MKKKLFSVLLSAAMVAGMAFPATATEVKAADSGEIYMFVASPEYADAINTLIEEYKNVEPDVTINYETTQNDYPTLLKAKLNSGDAPDIFQSTSGKEIEVYKEYSEDLSGQPLMDAMLPSVADSMKDADGNGCYGIGLKGNYFGLIYNKALLEQAGVESAPKTVDELKDCVEKLNAAGITPFTGGYGEWWVFKHIYQHFLGADVEDYQKFVADMEAGKDSLANHPLFADNFFNFLDLVKENGDAKPLEADLSAEIAAFASGQAAIMVGQGAWVEADIKAIDPEIDIEFAGYPVSDDPADCKVITGADQSLHVNKDSANKEAVLNFFNWWYTSDYGKAWFTDVAGVVPPITTDVQPDLQIPQQGAALVEADGSLPLGIVLSTDSLHQSIGEALQAYVGGNASKEDTIAAIDTKWVELDGDAE